jgi:hypothetical protein
MENEKELYIAEEKKRKESFDAWSKAFSEGDVEKAGILEVLFLDLTKAFCIHERHWSWGCSRCDELDIECFPERYQVCTSCKESVAKDEMDGYICNSCLAADEYNL